MSRQRRGVSLHDYCMENHMEYLLEEWDREKNGNLTPENVTAGINRKVWWQKSYDDERMGEHFDFSWQASVINRANGNGCPYLSGKAVWKGFNDLATTHPELAAQWHPDRNGDLKPEDVTAGSNKKVWWLQPYYDEKTGKHFNFEWQAVIETRANGVGCPYLSGRLAWKGFNDLATTHPELAVQWNYEKNGSLTPENVTAGSNKKVWWLQSYYDEKTGKHFEFEWESQISNRINGNGCPYPFGELVWTGFNDLATTHPELAAQWHPVKNGDLMPEDVSAGSKKRVWWLQSYDDEKTGKHFNFEWQASVVHRTNGNGCPYLTGNKVWKGFNDLATVNPELITEWDYQRNKIRPSEVTAGSVRKVWWKCSICGHGWKAKITKRKITGCPECAKEMKTSFPEQAIGFYLERHFPDTESGNWKVLDGKELDVYIPSIPAAVEYDGMRFHKNARRDLEKNQLCAEKGILLIRIREERCPSMEDAPFLKVISCIPGKEESLTDAIRQAGRILGISGMDVDVGRDRQEIYSRYIKRRKENSLAVTHPELAAQWDYEKNGSLTPENVTAGSNKKVWWLQSYDDEKTGRHFNFSWQAVIAWRTKGNGCPYLSGRAVWKGFNDLATTHPELAAQWHPSKNGNLTPEDVTAGSNKKVWWLQPYDDERTGRHFDFEWAASITKRVNGRGCPFLTGHKVWKGFNDLETYCRENGRLDILSQWDYEKNGNLKPSDVTVKSGKKVWWIKNGKSELRYIPKVTYK